MSLTSQKISLNAIVSKVYRDLDITEEYDLIDLIEWSVEALRFINAFQQYQEKPDCLEVCNYRTELPCDLVALLEVSVNGQQLDKASNNNFNKKAKGNFINKPYSYNLNSIDSLPLKLGRLYYLSNGDSFKIENGWIKTSFKEGFLDIKYNAIPTDENGLPLIPDDESYKEAITSYIKMKYFYKRAIKEDRFRWFYQDAEIKWNKYCNQAGTKAMMPDIFTLENIKRNYLSFIPNLKSYKNTFSDLNENI